MKYKKENDDHIEVHLKKRIFWWDGEKLCDVRKIDGTLETLHLEILDGQGYIVAPFVFPDKYGYDSKEGLIFPIKESVEWVEDIKTKQALLPKEKKEDILDSFIEEYKDFTMKWISRKLRNLINKGDIV